MKIAFELLLLTILTDHINRTRRQYVPLPCCCPASHAKLRRRNDSKPGTKTWFRAQYWYTLRALDLPGVRSFFSAVDEFLSITIRVLHFNYFSYIFFWKGSLDHIFPKTLQCGYKLGILTTVSSPLWKKLALKKKSHTPLSCELNALYGNLSSCQ